MKRKQLKFGKGFRVAIDSRLAQAAEMVSGPRMRKVIRKTGIVARTSGCTLFQAQASR